MTTLLQAPVLDSRGPIVFVRCPYCRQTHSHSWHTGTELRPIRPSHCRPFRPYQLAPREQAAA